MQPNTQPLPERPVISPRAVPEEFDGDGGQVVDLFDAAARIESRGYSDRSVARTYGYDSVFDLAGDVVDHGPRHRAEDRSPSVAYSMTKAWMRAALLVLGAVLAALVQAQLGAGSREMTLAGCSGWILGQAVAGMTWYRLRFDSKERAARCGEVVAIVCAAAALTAAFLLLLTGVLGAAGFGLVLGWVAYALAVSLLTVLDKVAVPLAVMMVAVVLQTTTWLITPQGGGSTGFLAVLPAITAVVAVVGYTVRLTRGHAETGTPEIRDLRGVAVPVAQAMLLASALVVALSAVPASHGTAFVATAVLLVACTDPGIVALRSRLSWFAHRSTSLLWSRRFAWGLASAAALLVALLAALLVVAVVEVTGASSEQITTTVVGTVLFSVLATLSSVHTAFGSPFRGLVPAGLALVVMLAFAAMSGAAVAVISAVVCLIALTLLMQQFSDARVFA
ncbi:hypothetical protein [Kocuria sp. SM24M-10]|uniref:hypothetical protein n=1 Tax=Kocuria sp. SM24M-10 TaxID=1660349 RepID=UPI00064A0464|nr:hypothetical protein [Kocuria sp. SM24M-10]KLU08312.1 hypothetical protein ABL57_18745 [Kocuria sp. SM24M-10]